MEENKDSVGKKKTALMGCMLVSGYYGAQKGKQTARTLDIDGKIQTNNWNQILHSTFGLENKRRTFLGHLVSES